MKKEIESRIIEEAKYLISTKKTIRELASYFNISKSTIHKDLRESLPSINKRLSNKVNNILQEHLLERHIRGGESTKIKYLKLKELNESNSNSYSR